MNGKNTKEFSPAPVDLGFKGQITRGLQNLGATHNFVGGYCTLAHCVGFRARIFDTNHIEVPARQQARFSLSNLWKSSDFVGSLDQFKGSFHRQ